MGKAIAIYDVTNSRSRSKLRCSSIVAAIKSYGQCGTALGLLAEPPKEPSSVIFDRYWRAKQDFIWVSALDGTRYEFTYIEKEDLHINGGVEDYDVYDCLTGEETTVMGRGEVAEFIGVSQQLVSKYLRDPLMRPMADRYLVKLTDDQRTWDEAYSIAAVRAYQKKVATPKRVQEPIGHVDPFRNVEVEADSRSRYRR